MYVYMKYRYGKYGLVGLSITYPAIFAGASRSHDVEGTGQHFV